MSFAPEHHDGPEAAGPPPSVQWRSWPLRDSVWGATGVVGSLAGAGVGVWSLTAKTHLALLAVAVLAIALWRFFLPVWFELNSEGVSQFVFGRRRRVPWKGVRHYEVCPSGVLLLPHADPCPLDACRGLYLPWGKNRQEVLAQVRYYLDRPPAP